MLQRCRSCDHRQFRSSFRPADWAKMCPSFNAMKSLWIRYPADWHDDNCAAIAEMKNLEQFIFEAAGAFHCCFAFTSCSRDCLCLFDKACARPWRSTNSFAWVPKPWRALRGARSCWICTSISPTSQKTVQFIRSLFHLIPLCPAIAPLANLAPSTVLSITENPEKSQLGKNEQDIRRFVAQELKWDERRLAACLRLRFSDNAIFFPTTGFADMLT